MKKVNSGQDDENHDDPLLKNLGRLARALGVLPVFIKRMR